MIRALILRNLRHHARLLLAVLPALALMELLIVWLGAQIDMGPGLLNLFEMMVPPAIRSFLNTRMFAFPGFVAFGFQHPVVLSGAIAFIVTVATVPAAERESGLLDLILARPLVRGHYLAGALTLVVGSALVLPLAVLAGCGAGLALVRVENEIAWVGYSAAAAKLALLLLCIGGYALLIAAVSRRRGRAVAQVTGLTLGFFFLDVLCRARASLAPLHWLTPFKYFDPVPAAVGPGILPRDVLVLLGAFVVTVAIAFARFRRQDL